MLWTQASPGGDSCVPLATGPSKTPEAAVCGDLGGVRGVDYEAGW